jgi:predicted DsbA family dithiol-disulfide isomerase
MSDAVEVVEYTDLLCGWAWGAEPQLRALRWRYGDRLHWRRALACMIDMPPLATPGDAAAFADSWATTAGETATVTGAPWPPRISPAPYTSVPGSLAVKAAQRQGDPIAERVARRVRERLYVFGKPTNDAADVAEAVDGVPTLDRDRLLRELDASDVRAEYDADVEEARNGANGFPTLVFRGPAGERTVSGWQPFEEYEAVLASVAPGAVAHRRADDDAATVLRSLGSTTSVDLLLICGSETPPPEAVVVDVGGGPLFLSADEAAARGVSR